MKITRLIETTKDTNRRLSDLSVESRHADSSRHADCKICIDIDSGFQVFQGFGGALTESSGYVLSQLPQEKMKEVVDAYFDKEAGNGYVYGRIHMNSCDFSLENWACVPEKDETLESFSMQRTDKYITPLVDMAARACPDGLRLMVTPWSPPAWMKDNNDMNNGGHLKREYWQLWAEYFARFLLELKNRGFDTELVSVQNEAAAVQTWDSCIWSAEEEGEFVAKHLGPTLEKAGFGSTKILVWDHNRDLLWDRLKGSMETEGAARYIAGAAYHWYSGDQYENVQECAKRFPDKQLVFSEGCVEGGPRNGAWYTGERYAHNIINDLNSGCTAWIDWNIALDMSGGPNHAGNYCDSPVLVDIEKGTLNFQSSYYYIGHFSRFIRPNARRLGTSITSGMTPATIDGRMGNTVEMCAFRNTDGSIALVITNRTEADITYTLSVQGGGNENLMPQLKIPGRSIQTIIVQ